MPTFVYDRALGVMVDKVTRAPMVDPNAPFVPSTPMTIPDIAPYQSPVTGEYISGRRAKADDLKRNNCIDANDLPRKTDGTYRNRQFAEKRGLTHLLKEDAK
jgi:hypothetical protein